MEDLKVDKRTKEYKEMTKANEIVKDAYATRENNPKFALCMHCGVELPPNEDGSPKWRKFPDPCDECIMRNK